MSTVLPPGASSGYLRLGANVRGKKLDYGMLVKATEILDAAAVPEEGRVIASHDVTDPVQRVELEKILAPTEVGPPKVERNHALQMGYTGDQCSNCNSMRMKIAGHCMVCEDCGTTTGCS